MEEMERGGGRERNLVRFSTSPNSRITMHGVIGMLPGLLDKKIRISTAVFLLINIKKF